jgi:hypothetical protein
VRHSPHQASSPAEVSHPRLSLLLKEGRARPRRVTRRGRERFDRWSAGNGQVARHRSDPKRLGGSDCRRRGPRRPTSQSATRPPPQPSSLLSSPSPRRPPSTASRSTSRCRDSRLSLLSLMRHRCHLPRQPCRLECTARSRTASQSSVTQRRAMVPGTRRTETAVSPSSRRPRRSSAPVHGLHEYWRGRPVTRSERAADRKEPLV